MNEEVGPLTDNKKIGDRLSLMTDPWCGEAIYAESDVEAAVRWFKDEILHTDEDFSLANQHGDKKCGKCGVFEPAHPVCPAKVQEKLGEAFGAVLNDQEGDR